MSRWTIAGTLRHDVLAEPVTLTLSYHGVFQARGRDKVRPDPALALVSEYRDAGSVRADAAGARREQGMVRNPDHVTIAVQDAASAITFFELLGFREDHVTMIDGDAPARYMGMPDMKAQHITLVLDGSSPHFEIQLLQFDPPPAADPGEHPTNLRRRGYNHLAFRVDDIAAATADLEAAGVKMLSEELDYISRRLRLFEGPEGITLELVEWVPSGDDQRPVE